MPETDKPPVNKCPSCGSDKIAPSLDVCDCWVDSSITPLVVSGYFEDEKLFKRLYPTAIRQQGHDIIRTWLFYTTLRCLLLTDKPPFREVLVNGHILGPDGHKMSKSKGNVISPEARLEEFGADALRQTLLSLTVGSDFPFNWEAVKYNKGFLQKVWSVSRFANQFITDYRPSNGDAQHLTILDKWILAKLADAIKKTAKAYDGYEFHTALDALQEFLWHDFCDQYIEAAKHRLYDKPSDTSFKAAQYTLYTVLWNANLALSPMCPHITEELYHVLFRNPNPTIHAERWPQLDGIPSDGEARCKGNDIVEAIATVRNEKAKLGIPLNGNLAKVSVTAPDQAIMALKEVEEDFKRILHVNELFLETGETLKVKLVEMS